MSYETCNLCDKGIITESDMFVFQHRPSGDIYFHLDCYAEKFRSIPVVGASQRGKDWINFAQQVLCHIENYTVNQYGDKGIDQLTGTSIEMCLEHAKKYINRYGRNSREGQQERDFFKLVHYVQVGFEKWKTGHNSTEEFIEVDENNS